MLLRVKVSWSEVFIISDYFLLIGYFVSCLA